MAHAQGAMPMPKFLPYDYSQSSMVVINFQDQLQPGTFEHAIHYLIDNKLDLSVFYPRFRNEETGRPAFDPAILLKIILFAYCEQPPAKAGGFGLRLKAGSIGPSADYRHTTVNSSSGSGGC